MEIRQITDDDFDAYSDLLSIVYLEDGPEGIEERFRELVEMDRSFAAFDGDELVGSISAFSLDVTVPGHRTLPMGGTTVVAVKPTHRRQGLLRRMMDVHLDDVRAGNEPLAGLWASEAAIYPRFGYGWATDLAKIEIDSAATGISGPIDPSVTVRMVDAETITKTAPALYEQVRPREPGAINRTDDWWRLRRLIDIADYRGGASSYRYAIAWRDGEPAGYVIYRTKYEYHDGIPAGEVRVAELLGIDVDAELALWKLLFDIDMTTRVKAHLRGVDDPLLHRLTDPRRYVQKVGDALYIRLMDVPTAMAGRTYNAEGRLVFEVTDQETAGVYEVETDGGGKAACQPSDEEPDIRLAAETLGAMYLGGRRADTLARAGKITGTDAGIRQADRMLLGDRTPWARDVF